MIPILCTAACGLLVACAAVSATSARRSATRAAVALAVAIHAERHGRTQRAAEDDAVQILLASCCEMWWTSAGTQHASGCRHSQGAVQ